MRPARIAALLLALAPLSPAQESAPKPPDPKQESKPATPKADVAPEAARGVPSASALMQDLMRVDQTPTSLRMALWMPTELFVSLAAQRDAPSATMDAVRELVRDYTIVMVAAGDMDPPRSMTFLPRSELEKVVAVRDTKDRVLQPLASDQIDPTMTRVLERVGVAMKQMLGKVGEGVTMMVFPGKDADGNPLADATKGSGRFTVEVQDKKFTYRLPLAALLPPKECPKCHESLSGSYNFCPYDGAELPKPKPDPAAPPDTKPAPPTSR